MELKELLDLLHEGGPAVAAALLFLQTVLQRKDLKRAHDENTEARARVVELENRVFELSSSYNKTVRKFEHGFSQTRELLTRIMDRL